MGYLKSELGWVGWDGYTEWRVRGRGAGGERGEGGPMVQGWKR